jgi:hypothetical protein
MCQTPPASAQKGAADILETDSRSLIAQSAGRTPWNTKTKIIRDILRFRTTPIQPLAFVFWWCMS